MISKQELIVKLLQQYLTEIKVGVIVKGVDNIFPEEIAKALSISKKYLYVAAIGYGKIIERVENQYVITDSIEKAVLWRSMPECAGSIIVFIKNDTDKLHSLAEFEVIAPRVYSWFLKFPYP